MQVHDPRTCCAPLCKAVSVHGSLLKAMKRYKDSLWKAESTWHHFSRSSPKKKGQAWLAPLWKLLRTWP